MKNFCLIIILLAFSLRCPPTACANQNNDSILWKATRGEKTIFILGATHFGFQEQYPVRPEILNALRQSSVYVTESIGPFQPEEQMIQGMLKMFEPADGKTLALLLEDKQCRELASKEHFPDAFEEIVGKQLFTKLMNKSPRAAIYFAMAQPAIVLSESQKSELKAAQPLEFYLDDQRKSFGLRHESLDPEIWEATDTLTPFETCNLLAGIVASHSAPDYFDRKGYEAAKNLRSLWVAGHSDDLVNFGLEWTENYAATHDQIERKWFAVRNVYMVQHMLQLSANEMSPLFVVVGAGHVSGQNGIIPKLREAGFAVKPL